MKKKTSKKKQFQITGLMITRFIIAAVTTMILLAIMAVAVTPPRYDISVGQPAPNTIKASKDVVDMITTQKLRDEAAASVKSIYHMDDSATDTAKLKLSEIFRDFRQIAVLVNDSEGGVNETQLAGANERLEGIELTLDELHAISSASDEQLSGLEMATIEAVVSALDKKIGENQVEANLEAIRAELLEVGISEALTDTAMIAVKSCLTPNYFFDAEATELARHAEAEKVAVVSRIKGEVIVSDGEIVTNAQYAMLDQLGMIKESTMDIYLYIGIAAIILILMIASTLYIKLFCPAIYSNARTLILIAIICVLNTGICILSRIASVYIMPVTLGMLLMTVLIHRRIALYMNLISAILATMLCSTSGSMFNMASYSIFISTAIGGVAAHVVLKTRQTRTGILLSGLLIAAANMASTFAVGLVATSNILDSVYCALYSGAGGILAAVMCMAFAPLLETLFNIVTTSRLIELSNPNHPLLRRLLLEAPGTYHHSIIVANLAEAAANAIGANALLARVGAYYHDVGKLKRPMYFKENQFEDNPHDRTDPRVSAAIIISHPKDGVALLKEHRIPEAIQEIVISHHGDTPVMWFYNKAKQDNDNADIADFRYPGPRPHSREAALIMLADTIEAAVRTLKEPTAQSMHDLIEKLIYSKLSDGQLNECSLSFADVGLCISAFVTVLSGAFHERIEYPNIEIPKRDT